MTTSRKTPLLCPGCGSTDWEWTWRDKPMGKPEIQCNACPYVGIMYVRKDPTPMNDRIPSLNGPLRNEAASGM